MVTKADRQQQAVAIIFSAMSKRTMAQALWDEAERELAEGRAILEETRGTPSAAFGDSSLKEGADSLRPPASSLKEGANGNDRLGWTAARTGEVLSVYPPIYREDEA